MILKTVSALHKISTLIFIDYVYTSHLRLEPSILAYMEIRSMISFCYWFTSWFTSILLWLKVRVNSGNDDSLPYYEDNDDDDNNENGGLVNVTLKYHFLALLLLFRVILDTNRYDADTNRLIGDYPGVTYPAVSVSAIKLLKFCIGIPLWKSKKSGSIADYVALLAGGM